MKKMSSIVLITLLAVVLTACGNNSLNPNGGNGGSASSVEIDGSSTVYPIMEAIAEEFQKSGNDARVNIGVSGTGGGFERFIQGETDISNASREIKKQEKKSLKEKGIEYTEFKIALDGLSVVVNKENDWVDQLTIEELNKIWSQGSGVTKWSDVREGWPDKEIKFFSPGTQSGTYDYFSEVVLGENQLKKKVQLSEDDNFLVNGVTGNKYGISYFGYAYYLENKDELKVVPIVNSEGKAVKPSKETIQNGTYEPLSRPLFIYVKNESVQKESVYNFLKFTFNNAGKLAEQVGYVGLKQEVYDQALEKIESLNKK